MLFHRAGDRSNPGQEGKTIIIIVYFLNNSAASYHYEPSKRGITYLNGHFVLGERSAPKQLVDAVNGEESCDVGT